MLSSIARDIRMAIRVLAKAPGFTSVSVLTLAVAIGAITAIFSVVDAVLLRPLPYPDADDLVRVAVDASGANVPELPFSDRGYWHFHDKNRSFDGVGGFGQAVVALTGTGEPTQVTLGIMTRSAFEVLGVSPLRGRFPTAEEDAPDGPLVALISSGLWANRFGSDPAIIGRTIELQDRTREVIGVMPPDFAFPSTGTDAWVPRQLNPESPNFGGHGIAMIARLREGATLESAIADSESLIQRFDEAGYTPQWLENVFTGRAILRTLKEELVGDSRRPLWIILGTVGFVLLIACSNVANLFLVRAEGRLRTTAVRIALGAGRARLVRYVLTESLLLALAGGVGGLFLASMGIRILVAIGPTSIPRLEGIGLNGTVFLFTAAVSIFTGILFGVLPALRVGSGEITAVLRDGGRGSTVGRERHRARSLLVITQVALALVLLVGSGLMVRSFQELRSVDPGFDAGGLITFGLSLPVTRYRDPQAAPQFFDDLLDRLSGLPGVESVGGISNLPLTGGGAILATQVEAFPTGPDDFPPTFSMRWVTPGYFETMGIPVIEGRTIERRDHQNPLPSLVISASVKSQFWPDVSALGQRFRAAGNWKDVVGVVGDVHDTGLEAAPEQILYMPLVDTAGRGPRAMSVAVRTGVDPESVIPLLRREVGSIDAALPLTEVVTMESLVGASMSRTSFTAFLLALAAVVALFLGSVGIYGMISYVVSQRTAEIGVRQALGSDSRGILFLILRQGMLLAVLGVAVGLAGAALLSRLLTTLLFGVSPFDILIFSAGPAVFLVVALLACLVPAWRAAATEPAEALRSE